MQSPAEKASMSIDLRSVEVLHAQPQTMCGGFWDSVQKQYVCKECPQLQYVIELVKDPVAMADQIGYLSLQEYYLLYDNIETFTTSRAAICLVRDAKKNFFDKTRPMRLVMNYGRGNNVHSSRTFTFPDGLHDDCWRGVRRYDVGMSNPAINTEGQMKFGVLEDGNYQYIDTKHENYTLILKFGKYDTISCIKTTNTDPKYDTEVRDFSIEYL